MFILFLEESVKLSFFLCCR